MENRFNAEQVPTSAPWTNASGAKKGTSDADLRAALFSRLNNSNPSARVVNELSIAGKARADVAVIDQYLHGYEIKSDRDTLRRLPHQVQVYSKVFDYFTLVVASAHTRGALAIIPSWWGVLEARQTHAGLALVTLKRGRRQRHNHLDSWYLSSLLWREETLELLARHELDRGLRSRPGHQLRDHLVANMPVKDLRDGVLAALNLREDWKPAAG